MPDTTTEEVGAGAAAADDEVAYAYVRNGDSLEKGAVIRIEEASLATYLLDPIKVPTYDKDGNKVGESFVSAAWPFSLKLDDKSPEAVRGFRAAAESEGYVFQFSEVSKLDWEKTV